LNAAGETTGARKRGEVDGRREIRLGALVDATGEVRLRWAPGRCSTEIGRQKDHMFVRRQHSKWLLALNPGTGKRLVGNGLGTWRGTSKVEVSTQQKRACSGHDFPAREGWSKGRYQARQAHPGPPSEAGRLCTSMNSDTSHAMTGSFPQGTLSSRPTVGNPSPLHLTHLNLRWAVQSPSANASTATEPFGQTAVRNPFI